MSFFEDIFPVLQVMGVSNNTLVSAAENNEGSLLQNLSQSMSVVTCGHGGEIESCRDESTALIFKLVAIASIFVAGVCGIAIPLVGKKRKFLGTDTNLFVVAKAFAAGVILATGFVHILPDATTALTDPCLPEAPWRKFPFSGFIAMMAALGTLLVEFVATQYYEQKQEKQSEIARVNSAGSLESGIVPSVDGIGTSPAVRVFGDEEGGHMHIVGIHAHAAHHRHSHSQEQGACAGNVGGHELGHSHPHVASGLDDESGKRHVVVSQVLELGILSHSVIIGLSLGVSQSPCTIRPLIGALTFHQFFEGFALGGCISQAQFKTLHSTLMASFFAVTTPFGVALGIAVSKSYNANSPRAVAIEGIFDSISAGILVYMALVDLIAADFLSKRMSCNARLQVVSYIALFLGAGLMSLLAIWA